MTDTNLALLALKWSIALTVTDVGLRLQPADLLLVVRNRSLFVRSMISMYAVMPLAALWMALVLPVPAPVKLALVAMSVAPVPPLVPGKATRAGGDLEYTASLLVLSCLVATVTIPLTLALLGIFRPSLDPGPVRIEKLVLSSVLAPMLVGMAIRRIVGRQAARLGRIARIAGTCGLSIGAVLLIGALWRPLLSLFGNGAIVAIVVFSGIALAAGHILGGPRPEDRRMLALATASRHPAIAVSVAAAVMPGERLAPAAILLTMLVGAIGTAWYLKE